MKLIAETACHHEGDFVYLKNLVSEINTRTGADIVKFHLTLDIDEYMAKDHELYNKIQSWIFNRKQWSEIFELVTSGEKDLMLLFNDTSAVEFGMVYSPSLIEVHSVSLNDINLLKSVRSNVTRDVKIVLGVGGSNIYEIENAISSLQHSNIILMFGFQNYPTNYQDINFAKMRRIMELFPEFEFGYADHTAWDNPNNVLITLLGAATGVGYIEKHVTTHFGAERIDGQAAISIEMFNELHERLELLDQCNGDGLLRLNRGEMEYSIYGPMKKAALLARDVKAGEVLSEELIIFKRTGQISNLSQLEVLGSIGRRFKKDVQKGKALRRDYLEES